MYYKKLFNLFKKNNACNNGFTLVEILAILAVLGILVMLVLPNIGGSIDSKKQREYEKIIGIIENAGKFYHSFNSDEYIIPIDTLIDEKYVTSDLTNPITGEKIEGCVRVIEDNSGFLTYKYATSCERKEVKLEVRLNDGKTSQEFESIYYDSTVITLINPTRENVEFIGWTVKEGNSIIKDDKLIIGDEDTIIEANWDELLLLTLELDGGRLKEPPKTAYKPGSIINLYSPEKEGHVFVAWQLTEGKGNINGNRFTMDNEDATLKAIYKPIIVQAIYSETDNSLMFINDVQQKKGDTYKGKKVTEVYTGFTNIDYINDETIVPWYLYRTSIKKVEFLDWIKPKYLSNWFKGFSSCTEMNLRKLDTSNVISLYHTFDGMSSIEKVDVSIFDTRNVINMSGMFARMTNLVSLDISNFNTNKVTNMGSMFNNCNQLTTIKFNNASFDNVSTYNDMFYNVPEESSTNKVYIIVKDDNARNWLNDKIDENKRTIVTVDEL